MCTLKELRELLDRYPDDSEIEILRKTEYSNGIYNNWISLDLDYHINIQDLRESKYVTDQRKIYIQIGEK